MAEKSLFWTTGATGDGASEYTQAETIRWLRQTFVGDDTDEGPLRNYLNELEVTGAATPVAVNTGGAVVYGFPYWNTASENVTIPTPSGNTRIDRIVLRASWSAQTVRITRVAGSEGSGTPPALTQTDGTTWEISLAQVSITTGGVITVTDERVFLHPNVEVETAMIEDAAVTNAKLRDGGACSVVGRSANSGGDVADIAAAANEQVLMRTGDALSFAQVDTAQIATGAVDTTELAADAVDDTKAGDRMPQFYRRQGGSATIWRSSGTTNRTPGAVRMQGGIHSVVLVSQSRNTRVITFPTGFSYAPLVFLTPLDGAEEVQVSVDASSTVGGGFTIVAETVDGSNISKTVYVQWLAIGPE